MNLFKNKLLKWLVLLKCFVILGAGKEMIIIM